MQYHMLPKRIRRGYINVAHTNVKQSTSWQVWMPVVAAIVSAAASAYAAVWVANTNSRATERSAERAAVAAFDAKMVEIGVNILAADPGKADVVPARQWAIDLVEKHSGQRFDDEDRSKLLHSPIVICREIHGMSMDLSDPCRSVNPILP